MDKNSKRKLTISIFFISVMLTAGLLSLTMNQEVNNDQINPIASADPNDAWLSDIRLEHIKGTETIKWYLEGTIQASIPSTLTTGLYNIKVSGLKFKDDVMETLTGEPKSYGETGSVPDYESLWGQAIAYSTSATAEMNCQGETTWFILPNNDTFNTYQDIQWAGNQGSLLWERSGSGGTTPLYYTDINLDYLLYPILSIDSEFYGLHNIRIKIYSPEKDLWIEQDPNNIILDNPYYKVRVLDLNGGLLYEDQSLQIFKSYRTITIDSIRINNNSPETIRIVGANEGHYKGQYSFTEELDYTRPSYLQCSDTLEDCYVIPVKNNHAKVLYSNFDSSWLRVGIPFGSLDNVVCEFWVLLTDRSATQSLYLDGGSDFGNLFVFHSSGYIRYYDASGSSQSTTIPYFENQWYHVRMEFERNNYIAYYLNNSLIYEENSAKDIQITNWKSQSPDSQEVYFDSIDFDFSPDYYLNRNMELNNSQETYSQISCQNFANAHYQGLDSYEESPLFEERTDYIEDASYPTSKAMVIPIKHDYGARQTPTYYGYARGYGIAHNNPLQLYSDSAYGIKVSKTMGSVGAFGNVEFYMFSPFIDDADFVNVFLKDSAGNNIMIFQVIAYSGASNTGKGEMVVIDATGTTSGINLNWSHWNHYRLNFTCGSDLEIYLNDEAVYTGGQANNYGYGVQDIVFEYTISGSKTQQPYIFLDALDWSGTDSEYYINRNQQFNTTYMNPSNFTALIQPYSSIIVPYTQYSDLVKYNLTDIYGNLIVSDNLQYAISIPSVIDYIPPSTAPVYIAIEDQESNDLSFSDYRIVANGIESYTNILYLPINQSIEMTLYDRFDNLLDSKTETIERTGNILNFTIEQYDLKILNLQKITSAILINRTGINDRNISEIVVSNEVFSTKLTPDTYNFYYVDESDNEIFLSIDVSEEISIVLNTTYRDMTFALFDESGLGLNNELVRFYVNGQRKPVGVVNVPKGYSEVAVLDYFNATLYNESLNLDLWTEFNIYCPVYTMFVGHNNTEIMELVIERSDVTFTLLQQPISPNSALQFKFLAGIDYIVTIKYLNGTIHESRTISLVANNEIVSFGFYEEPYRPDAPTDSGIPDYLIWLLVGVVFVMIVVSIFQRNKIDKINQQQRRTAKKPKSRTGIRPKR